MAEESGQGTEREMTRAELLAEIKEYEEDVDRLTKALEQQGKALDEAERERAMFEEQADIYQRRSEMYERRLGEVKKVVEAVPDLAF